MLRYSVVLYGQYHTPRITGPQLRKKLYGAIWKQKLLLP